MGNGFEAAIKLQLPPNADLSGRTKYPMLVDVYAGPGSYAGTSRFDRSFASYLTTNRSYVYAQINGRGSGNRGERLLHTIYRSMGTVEIDDQITGAKYAFCSSFGFHICFIFYFCYFLNIYIIAINSTDCWLKSFHSSMRNALAFGAGATVATQLVLHWPKTILVYLNVPLLLLQLPIGLIMVSFKL